VAMVDELAALVRHFGTPVISGKDSSAGSVETDEGLVSVPPAVFLSALGKVRDVAGLLGEEWTGAGNVLVRIGPATPALAATVAARALGVGAVAAGPIDTVALDAFEDYLAALAAHRSSFRSGTPIGPGGVTARLVAGTLAGGLGVEVAGDQRTAEALLAEHRVGALVEVPPGQVGRLPDALAPVVVGTLTAAPGVHVGGADLLTQALRTAWQTAFERRIA
jgi:phosphoribosylformylglycinamidine (FGAM) synthase-like enzyme